MLNQSFRCTVVLLGALIGLAWSQGAFAQTELSSGGQELESRYTSQLDRLRDKLTPKLRQTENADLETLDQFLASDSLDDELATYVVLYEATPGGLAAFAQQSSTNAQLIENLLQDPALMKRMLVADGAKAKQDRRGVGPAQYGPAMQIYRSIQKIQARKNNAILQRLALAVSLEHAIPVAQSNAESQTDAPEFIDPVKRYQHYEKAYLAGELDPAFEELTTWDLRMVVNGDEPDETLAWGREMLRNFRPDHVYHPDFGWRYVSLVRTDVKYGSENVKNDRPELQRYQNILMNGGVCGRRAFIGRFILRAFGVPTIARPSRGHGALAHWTPDGWVVNLGGDWGCGWTKTRYRNDVDFLATTQARRNPLEYLKVKRAQWAGDVLQEKRTHDAQSENPDFWNGVALRTRDAIVEKSNAVTLSALGEDLGEANEPTIAEKVMASPVTAADRKIVHGEKGEIVIPAAAYHAPKGNTRDVTAMKSFGGGLQIFLPRFFPQGQTVLRGGTWKGDPDACTSGRRMLSGGYGRYENWGLRAAISVSGEVPQAELNLELDNGATMEFVYIKPGSFPMGGEREKDGRFECVEVPVHEVTLTKGFYLGKYEVTQEQYEAVMGSNPSRSTKSPDCPVDNVSESDAVSFCGKLAENSGLDVRLPTEAEWEYASRAGRSTKWFFGDDAKLLGDYAWFKGNADAKSHPVGQKKPNPWGLYDIYGNVCERISDKYARNYYSISPKVDPTGPSQGTKSRLEYQIDVHEQGRYVLSARVATANDGQRLNVSVDGGLSVQTLELPFTLGKWQDSKSVTLDLNRGKNTIRFWRDQPPQYGIAIKEFVLTPIE